RSDRNRGAVGAERQRTAVHAGRHGSVSGTAGRTDGQPVAACDGGNRGGPAQGRGSGNQNVEVLLRGTAAERRGKRDPVGAGQDGRAGWQERRGAASASKDAGDQGG